MSSLPTLSDYQALPAYDPKSLDALKRMGKDNSPEAIHAAARQLESVFLGMVLKSMREAAPQDGFSDSEQTRTYQGMLDQQLAQTLSAKGQLGLAAMIEKQLNPAGQGNNGNSENGAPLAAAATANSAVAAASSSRIDPNTWRNAARHALGLPPQSGQVVTQATAQPGANGAANTKRNDFVEKLWPHAVEAAKRTGIPAHFMIGHAALESGWGKAEITNADGSPSHNLFGIKASKSWGGGTADTLTTEYIGGVPQKRVERFRSYASYADAFTDYARLLQSRYGQAIGTQDARTFAQGLQKGGYATDPMYAAKLERIISGKTLRQRLMG